MENGGSVAKYGERKCVKMRGILGKMRKNEGRASRENRGREVEEVPGYKGRKSSGCEGK